MNTNLTLSLDLSFPPEWARIDRARETVAHSVAAVYADDELRDALSIVSAELLENAVRYGAPGQAAVRITIQELGGEFVVRVTNEVDSTTTHAGLLQRKLTWLARFGSPADAYVAALQEVYERGAQSSQSGLGLVRVAYEGGCRLACEHDGSGAVTVRAVRPRLPPPTRL